MRRRIGLSLIAFAIAIVSGFAQEGLPAFPGAEGSGKYVTGGRGGRVIYVTTLEDNSSVGSLRYAINQSGPRIIMFKVGGTIQLKSRLSISKGDVTIAGQTAPGDGITIRDYQVEVKANNVIIRFMRFRMGDETKQEADALGGRNYQDIIIDHCSMSWSTDECVSFYGNENFTMQWCLASESLRISVHGKGKHGYGGIWGGEKASFHHNLLAHHDSRNPRFCGSRYTNRPDDEIVDFRNNVLYNWGANTIYAAEGGTYNLINNYYKAGPASSNKSRIIQPYADDGKNQQPMGIYGKFYIDGNYMTASTTVTNNNWQGVNMHSSFSSRAPGVTLNDLKSDTEFAHAPITTHSSEKAYEKVVNYCGASFKRDAVDIRIINDVTSGTATYMDGGNGSKNGLIDSQSAVGGWPVLQTADAPVDSDNDGMPDEWETANNLNPGSDGDAQLTSVDGSYPNLEVYLNSLVSSIIEDQNSEYLYTATSHFKSNANEIKLYFNSQANEIIINHDQSIKQVSVYSITGKLLVNNSYDTKSVRMGISNLQHGVYIVKVLDRTNKMFAKKVAVN